MEYESSLNAVLTELRAFLLQTCGGLQEAFLALDVHRVGQLTYDDFATGLQNLGYSADCAAAFRALANNGEGLLLEKTFWNRLAVTPTDKAACGTELKSGFDDCKEVKPLGSGNTNVDWSVTFRRGLSPSKFRQVGCTVRKESSDASGIILRKSQSSDNLQKCSAPADEEATARPDLYERIGRLAQENLKLQNRVADMERNQANLVSESKLLQQLADLQQQLSDERKHGLVALSALRASVEATRQWQTGGEAVALVHGEVERTVAESRPLIECAIHASLGPRFDALENRLLKLENMSESPSDALSVQRGKHGRSEISVWDEVQRALGEARPQIEGSLEVLLGSRLASLEDRLAEIPADVLESRLSDLESRLEVLRPTLQPSSCEQSEQYVRIEVQQALAEVRPLIEGSLEGLLDRRIEDRIANIPVEAFERRLNHLEDMFDGGEPTVPKQQSSCEQLQELVKNEVRLSLAEVRPRIEETLKVFLAGPIDAMEDRAADVAASRNNSSKTANLRGLHLTLEGLKQDVDKSKPFVHQLMPHTFDAQVMEDLQVFLDKRVENIRQELLSALEEERLHNCQSAEALSQTISGELEARLRGQVQARLSLSEELGTACDNASVRNERRLVELQKDMHQMKTRMEEIAANSVNETGSFAGKVEQSIKAQHASMSLLRGDLNDVMARINGSVIASDFQIVQKRLQELKQDHDDLEKKFVQSELRRQSEANSVKAKLHTLISKTGDSYRDPTSLSESKNKPIACVSGIASIDHTSAQTSPTAASSADLASPASEALLTRRKLCIPGLQPLQGSSSVPKLPVGNATLDNVASNRCFRSQVGTPNVSERSGDAVATEAIEALQKLREENLRLREENIGIREMSMATQSLAENAVKLARSASPVRNPPAQSSSVTRSPPLPSGTLGARSNPRLLGRLSSAPGSAASVSLGRSHSRTAFSQSGTEPFQPIGVVGPEVERRCAALAQANSQPNDVLPAAASFGRRNVSSLARPLIAHTPCNS